MMLTSSETSRIRRCFTNATWIMGGACQWYWLPTSRRVSFRVECRSTKPIPRGAFLIGTYDREHLKEFLDDLEDIVALAAAKNGK